MIHETLSAYEAEDNDGMASDLRIFESRGCGIPECAEDVLLGAVDVVAQRGDDPPPQQRPDALAPRLTLQRRADRHHLFVE